MSWAVGGSGFLLWNVGCGVGGAAMGPSSDGDSMATRGWRLKDPDSSTVSCDFCFSCHLLHVNNLIVTATMASLSLPPPPVPHVVSFPQPHVLLVTLDRPQQLNAVTRGMHAPLHRLWAWFDEEPSLRCAVLTGRGRAFSAGADLREWHAAGSGRDDAGSWADGGPRRWRCSAAGGTRRRRCRPGGS